MAYVATVSSWHEKKNVTMIWMNKIKVDGYITMFFYLKGTTCFFLIAFWNKVRTTLKGMNF